MIEGVKIIPLKTFSDERGKVMHMVKNTDSFFDKFGEVYFSTVLPGKIKAWNRRNMATRNYVVVEGNIKLVLYDGKEIQEINMGEDNYCLVQIPPRVWSGFGAIGERTAIVADLTDLPYSPEDSEKADAFSLIDYWRNEEII